MAPKNSSPGDGFLVVFEGPNGCGTTTHWLLAAKFLIQKDLSIITTREPGGTKYGEKLRKHLLDPDPDWQELEPRTEYFHLCASRSHNVNKRIIPALESGKIVLCDRFFASSIVFQGYAGNKDLLEAIENINSLATYGVQPDLRIILNIDYKVAQKRLGQQDKGVDKFEKKEDQFQLEVSRAYKKLTQKLPNTIGLDSTRSMEENSEDIRKELQILIPSLGS